MLRRHVFQYCQQPPRQVRQISVNSAINRTLRRSTDERRPAQQSQSRDAAQEHEPRYSTRRFGRRQDGTFQAVEKDDLAPSLPYTTAASEFLYGSSVIEAALAARRRKLYKLYIYEGPNCVKTDTDDFALRRLALNRSVPMERLGPEARRSMDRMSHGRPHNGYLLEASPLPIKPALELSPIPSPAAYFHYVMGHQSREEEAVNGKSKSLPCTMQTPRFPFVLLLDGILDGGNLGAILRSAFFLGVDAVAISSHSATLGPVALKASAGAAEMLPLLRVDNASQFLESSKKNGWKSYAADAPGSQHKTARRSFLASQLNTPLLRNPCILIMGSEGDGLRWKVQRLADYDIGIDGPRCGKHGIDSLNVSVAAALLCQAFLDIRPPGSALPDILF